MQHNNKFLENLEHKLFTIKDQLTVQPSRDNHITYISIQQEAVNVTLAKAHGHQFLMGQEGDYVMIMEWTGGDSFQLSVQGIPVPCSLLGSGYVGERVYFQREGSKIISLTIPGLEYGLVYKKQP